jgi:hypothetical protein
MCSYCRENFYIRVICQRGKLSCICAFYSRLLKTCCNRLSQTSSDNCVLSILSWSAKCNITVELLYERESLMAAISETLVYFAWTCFWIETLYVIVIWQALYSILTLANVFEALSVAGQQLGKCNLVKHLHLEQSYSLLSHLKCVLHQDISHWKMSASFISSIWSP